MKYYTVKARIGKWKGEDGIYTCTINDLTEEGEKDDVVVVVRIRKRRRYISSVEILCGEHRHWSEPPKYAKTFIEKIVSDDKKKSAKRSAHGRKKKTIKKTTTT